MYNIKYLSVAAPNSEPCKDLFAGAGAKKQFLNIELLK
jgi:hypothetical protein